MKIRLFLLFSVIYINVLAQIKFAPIGASWHYNKQELLENEAHGYTVFIVDKDTIINSKLMKSISAKEFLFDGSSKELPKIYLHVTDSQVYKLVNVELKLAYDFTLEIGDTLKIEYLTDELCNSITPIILDSIGEVIVNDDTLMVQYFSYSERYFEDSDLNKIKYTVIEKIGNIGGVNDFVKVKQICTYESSPVNLLLRCYNDMSIHYTADWLNNGFENDCEYLINKVSIPTIDNFGVIKIFPNPVKDKLSIGYCSNFFNIIVYDVKGNRLFQVDNKSVLDVSTLPQGLYFLRLVENGVNIQMLKFLKE